MQRSSRVDYDAIAPLYDSQPHREKSPDPALATFLAKRSPLGTALLLDIACGTGNQLVANRAIASSARMVGFDRSIGMLRQARAKSAEIGWIHGDSSALPFASDTFDFASCQYALHHFRDKDTLRCGVRGWIAPPGERAGRPERTAFPHRSFVFSHRSRRQAAALS